MLRRKGLGRYLGVFFNLSDIALFNLLFAVTLWFLGGSVPVDRSLMWILINISFLGAVMCQRRFPHSNRAILLDRVAADTLSTIGLHALFLLSLSELFNPVHVDLKLYLIYYGLVVCVMTTWNLIVRRCVKNIRRRGFNFKRVVIVGTNSVAERLLEQLGFDSGYGYRILGFFDDEIREKFRYSDKYVGQTTILAEYVKENKVDQIYYTIQNRDDDEMKKIIKIADDTGVEFFYVPHVKGSLGRDYTLLSVGAMPVLAGRNNPLKNPLNQFVKRTFDLTASSVFLITVYPFVYIPVAIAIKLSSPGPVYFKQKRTGYRGESFDCLKFRTMRVNKGADTCQATKDDPRKTRVGDFLRRTSLDELPQFINVFKGDMSIIGPRPHMLKHTEDYSKLIDQYMARHIVKPGITGWAQINGFRGPTDELWKMEKRVEFDVWYIEHWTMLLDLKIVVRTVLNAIRGEKNAY